MNALFRAKTADLGIQYFEGQYLRFVDYCQKYCVNRRLHLVDVMFSDRTDSMLNDIESIMFMN